jgi:hypothetical protein
LTSVFRTGVSEYGLQYFPTSGDQELSSVYFRPLSSGQKYSTWLRSPTYTSRLQKVESPLLTFLNLRCPDISAWLKSPGSLGLPYLYFLPLLAKQEYLVRELYTTDPRVLRDFPPLFSDICLPEHLIRDTLVFRPLLSKYSCNKKYPIEREATIIFHYFV